MLPRLKSGGALPALRVREWDYRDANALGELAESLDVTIGEQSQIQIDAIPDVWAKVLGFATVLRDRTHPLHSDAENAFRGFLAFLALTERKRLPVQIQPVSIQPRPDLGRLLSVCERLRPSVAMTTPGEWDQIFVFQYADSLGRQNAGTTSPLTLVCPNEGMHLNLLAPVPWFQAGRFVNPRGFLNAAERQHIAAWVDHVHALLRTAGIGGWQAPWNALMGALLMAFRADLAGAAVLPAPVLSRRFTLSGKLYRVLEAVLAPADVPSDVMIRPLRGTAPGLTLLLCDRDLPRKWTRSREDIVFSGPHTYADVLAQEPGTDHTRLGTIQLPANAEWRKPEELFLPRLTKIVNEPNAFPGALAVPNQEQLDPGATPIPPVIPELLGYVRAGDLRNALRYEDTGQGVRVHLRLALSGGDVEIHKDYTAGDIITTTKLAAVEIWPAFRHVDWHVYYTFWSSGQDRMAFRAEPYIPPGEQMVARTTEGNAEITELGFAPDFLVLSRDGRPIGVLPVAMEELSRATLQPVHAGVDFGTTNSHVGLRVEGVIEPLALKNCTHRVTNYPAGDRQGLMWRLFLPPEDETAPFLSFFRTRSGAPNVVPIPPVLNGHILFYNEQHSDLNATNIYPRLKWTAGRQVMVEAYLKQLCLLAAAEAFRLGANSIVWNYSLPSAFPVNTRNQFQVLWGAILGWTQLKTGIPFSGPHWLTESVAAARYFSASGAHPVVGTAVADIGGGTSDVSIWQQTHLLWQSSILLSGNELFFAPLFYHRAALIPALLANLSNEELAKQWSAALTNARVFDQFVAQIDPLLRSRGEEIIGRVLSQGSRLAPVTSVIALGLCGMFYYLGLMIRALREQGTYLDRIEGAPATPDLHFGGNGSKLFHWVANGRWFPNSPVNRVFSDMLLSAAQLPERPASGIQIEINTQNPKCEAAYGLVTPIPFATNLFDNTDDRPFTSVIAGEPFSVNGTGSSASGNLTAENLTVGVRAEGIPALRDFVSRFQTHVQGQHAVIEPIPGLDGSLLDQVHLDVINWLGLQQGRNLADVQVEPLFVVGLKILLRRATRLWPLERPA
jgi:hypothetical protein